MEQSVKPLPTVKRTEMEEHNKARRAMGLPLIRIRVRTCIVCKGLFESTGKRNCGCHSSDSYSIQGREIL